MAKKLNDLQQHDQEYRNPKWNFNGRQLWLWVSYSSASGYFSMSPTTQKTILKAESMAKVRRGTTWILTLGLFERDEKNKGRFNRTYLPNETKLEYFNRALTKVNVKLALIWKIQRLIASKGCAPHSNQQFANELKRNVVWISRCLKQIVADGVINRYGGSGRKKSYYCDPADKDQNAALLERYGEHVEEDVRRESYQPKVQVQIPSQPKVTSEQNSVVYKRTTSEGIFPRKIKKSDIRAENLRKLNRPPAEKQE